MVFNPQFTYLIISFESLINNQFTYFISFSLLLKYNTGLHSVPSNSFLFSWGV
jgi:hypothetical protein